MLRVMSNGSKFAGQLPDPVEKLIEVLGKEPLDPTVEGRGSFIDRRRNAAGTVRFFGNFARRAHVFNIRTDDPAMIAALTRAIRDNQATPEYQRLRAGYHPCAHCGRLAMFCRCRKAAAPTRPVTPVPCL